MRKGWECLGWLGVCLVCLSGCGKPTPDPDVAAMVEASNASRASEKMAAESANKLMGGTSSAQPPLPEAPKPLQKKSGADLSTPLEKYVLLPMEDQQRDLVYLYAALGGKFPRGDTELLEMVSAKYYNERDAFKKKEIEALEKPRVQEEIDRHKDIRYIAFSISDAQHERYQLSAYDFDKKGFSLSSFSSCADSSWRAGSGLALKTFNTSGNCLGSFGFLPVPDVEVARKIEALRSSSQAVLQLIVYAYAEEAGDGHIFITPTALRMRVLDRKQFYSGGDPERLTPAADLMVRK